MDKAFQRSQFQHPNGLWYKHDKETGQIIDINEGGQKHKGVRAEKKKFLKPAPHFGGAVFTYHTFLSIHHLSLIHLLLLILSNHCCPVNRQNINFYLLR
jgi:hypothetical protein